MELKSPKEAGRARAGAQQELTVCDITGDWGAYQWSLTLFATLYSSLLSMTVVVGPIWTPQLRHLCGPANGSEADFGREPFQCRLPGDLQDCPHGFLFDDADEGKVLTNTFQLVCEREWLRSFLSSSALLGMLLSSVSLGQLSDKLGRVACVRAGLAVSVAATVGAILVDSYLWLNICFFFMSFAQVGVGNALSTLVMESTSPRFRLASVFEYGIGWGLGMLGVPLLHRLTRNYQLFLSVSLAVQLLLLVWFKLAIFESARWLLSEGKIERAQIVLQCICKLNRVQNGAQLAAKIAQMQVQRLRKASSVIEGALGGTLPRKRSCAELGEVLGAISRQLSGSQATLTPSNSPKLQPQHPQPSALTLSPTLARQSFSIDSVHSAPDLATIQQLQQLQQPEEPPEGAQELVLMQPQRPRGSMASMAPGGLEPASGGPDEPAASVTAQAISQLALQFSRDIERQDQGSCFLVQLFHRKLYKVTLVLMSLSLMLETSYFGLVQANKFVGSDVGLNYIVGALAEWLAALVYVMLCSAFSRRVALLLPTLSASICCLAIAGTYQLLGSASTSGTASNVTAALQLTGNIDLGSGLPLGIPDQPWSAELQSQLANLSQSSPVIDPSELERTLQLAYLLNSTQGNPWLRDRINFWLMNAGKFAVTVCIQVAATLSMESYPNNLRQTGPGAIVFIGRMGSILAPFLFNDPSPDKFTFKVTLTALACLGLTLCCVIPFFVRDNKHKDLSDTLDDVDHDRPDGLEPQPAQNHNNNNNNNNNLNNNTKLNVKK